jgi:hypothetical protein
VTRRTTVLLLLAAAAGALLVRMLGAEEVFRGEDVVFRGMDAYYHARRALYSLVHFPELLQRDAYLNFPYGSAVPWPPFYDLLLAALAKLLGGGQATLDRVGALLPPLFAMPQWAMPAWASRITTPGSPCSVPRCSRSWARSWGAAARVPHGGSGLP